MWYDGTEANFWKRRRFVQQPVPLKPRRGGRSSGRRWRAKAPVKGALSYVRAKKASLKKTALPDARQTVRRALPSVLTVLGLCLGLTSVRFALAGRIEYALFCILGAALCDVLDGRVARLLASESEFGAELDSLADFLCYGVAPALLAYIVALGQWPGKGWVVCLCFASCSAMRLARFNVYRLLMKKMPWGDTFFVGVPAPAGALVALLPLLMHFGVPGVFGSVLLPWSLMVSFAGSAALMLSHWPTPSLKSVKITRRQLPVWVLGVTFLVGALMGSPWATLAVIGTGYVLALPLCGLYVRRNFARSKTAP